MSMEDLWPRQSVHGWVLFLGIKSVYNDYKQQIKVKEITEASASVGLLLATAVAGRRFENGIIFQIHQLPSDDSVDTVGRL